MNDVDLSLIHEYRVIAVNNAYGDPIRDEKGKLLRYAPREWVDVLFYGDCRWLRHHRKWLTHFQGLRVTCCVDHKGLSPWVHCIERRNSPKGIITSPGMISWNLSSGAAAINLAVHFGVKKIVLIGYDMRKIGDETNWHRDHPNHMNPRRNPYDRFLRPFPDIARDLKQLGVECVNATPGSALKEFPITNLEKALC